MTTKKKTPKTPPTLDQAVRQARTAIVADIKAGLVPVTVKTFVELHDFVDANDYLSDFVSDSASDDRFALANAVSDQLDAWLREGDHHAYFGGAEPAPAIAEEVDLAAGNLVAGWLENATTRSQLVGSIDQILALLRRWRSVVGHGQRGDLITGEAISAALRSWASLKASPAPIGQWTYKVNDRGLSPATVEEIALPDDMDVGDIVVVDWPKSIPMESGYQTSELTRDGKTYEIRFPEFIHPAYAIRVA